MTILEYLKGVFGDFDGDTRVKSRSSTCEGEYSIDKVVVDHGPRRTPITITIRTHIGPVKP